VPVPAPILDDRSYQQLRDELVRRIPIYAPEWTDINPSDPGIALVELFAFLGENLLFRFNQIPETTRLEFLRLLGVPLQPAVPARTLVTFTSTEPAGALVASGKQLNAGSKPFETLVETVVWPISCVGVSRTAAPLPDDEEIRRYAANVVEAAGLKPGERAVYYSNEYLVADPSAAGATSVDVGAAVDRMLWIAVLGERGVDPAKLAGQTINVGVIPDLVVREDDAPTPSPGAGAQQPSPPPLRWQVSTYRPTDAEPVYRALEIVGDSTRGLTRDGVVRLRLPKDPDELKPFPAPTEDVAGTRDLPPELERDEDRKKLLFWLRVFRDDGGRFGRMLWVGANAAETEQAATAATEFLGTGTAQANQRVRLAQGPVLAGPVALEVEEAGGWSRWQQVDGFFASREDDRHYVLDPEAGEILFGDGVRGRPPQIGERIRAAGYRYGGGRDGNVAPKAITALAAPAVRFDDLTSPVTVKAANPLAARGGLDAETVAAALDRIPGELRRRDRAVTEGDFRELALETPGADVGRAECLPLFHPLRETEQSPGVVTVVVWPREDRRAPDAPMPDATLLRMVCAWLDLRRLVTTELYVLGPLYREIAVSVSVEVKDGYGVEAVRRWVELVLRQYLAPLPPYGPEGGGWPLARPVLAPELQAAALQVEGVRYLNGLELAVHGDDGVWRRTDRVELTGRRVPKLGNIVVTAFASDDPRVDRAPPDPTAQPEPVDDGAVAVPVPVPKVEC
jgi:predicted phage baseplate assembly protein